MLEWRTVAGIDEEITIYRSLPSELFTISITGYNCFTDLTEDATIALYRALGELLEM